MPIGIALNNKGCVVLFFCLQIEIFFLPINECLIQLQWFHIMYGKVFCNIGPISYFILTGNSILPVPRMYLMYSTHS